MAEEAVQALAVEDGSGTCPAGFASDGASRVESPSSTRKSPIEHAIVTNKRCKVTKPRPEELFEELYIDPIIHEVS